MHALLLARDGVRALLDGRNPQRRALAQSLGIDTVDAGDTLGKEAVLAETAGRGADAVIDCTGSASVWESAPELVRRGGAVSFFGGLPEGTRVSFTSGRVHYDEIRLISPFHFAPDNVKRARDVIASRALPLGALLSHAYSLDHIADAFALLDAGEGTKMVIEP